LLVATLFFTICSLFAGIFFLFYCIFPIQAAKGRSFLQATAFFMAAPHNSACRITGQCAPSAKKKAQLLLCVTRGWR
jgi:hypothetical protein